MKMFERQKIREEKMRVKEEIKLKKLKNKK